MTNIQEVLNSLSFDSNNEEAMTSNPDGFASNPSAREVELEKEVARLTEKVEELSSFCHYVCKRLDSVEKTQNKFIDTASRKIQNEFENLEFVYDEKIRRIIAEAEDNKYVADLRKKRIEAYERQKIEAVRREETLCTASFLSAVFTLGKRRNGSAVGLLTEQRRRHV